MVCASPTKISCENCSRETRQNLSFKIVGNAGKTQNKEIRNDGREISSLGKLIIKADRDESSTASGGKGTRQKNVGL